MKFRPPAIGFYRGNRVSCRIWEKHQSGGDESTEEGAVAVTHRRNGGRAKAIARRGERVAFSERSVKCGKADLRKERAWEERRASLRSRGIEVTC